ncbi:MAG: glycosyltransferase family 87 protein [Deltaproteobacteria bacterium]
MTEPSMAPSAGPVQGRFRTLAEGPAVWRLLVLLAVLGVQGRAVLGRYEPNHWLYRDGAFYYDTLRAIVEHGSLDQGPMQPHSWYEGKLGWNYNLTDDWSNVAVGKDGTWYPKHPLLMPIVSVPFYLALGPIGTLVLNLMCGVLGALLAAELAARFAARWVASLLGVGLGAMPLIVREAYGYNNDLFYALLVVLAALLLEDDRPGWAGLCAGFAVFAKVTNVFFLLPFALWSLRGGDFGKTLRFALTSSIGIAVTAGFDWALFGAPWITAYHRVLVVQAGHPVIRAHTRLFGRDFWEGLRAVWGLPPHPSAQAYGITSVFVAYPVALLGTLAIAWRRRRPWEAAALLFAIGWPLFFFAKYEWYRDDFWDPSLWLCAAPLAALAGLVVPPTPTPRVSRRTLALALGAAGGLLAFGMLGRGAVALAERGKPWRLVAHVTAARVAIESPRGEIPCDYFNNQTDRWECTSFDHGQDWLMTGVTLAGKPRFGGQLRTLVTLSPSPSGPRRLTIDVPAKRVLRLSYGIPEGSAPVPVDLSIRWAGREVARETVSGSGLRERLIDTQREAGKESVLELEVSGQPTPARGFYVDGEVQ